MKKLTKWLKKYFIPHGENNYKPHFLRNESMLLITLAVIVVELAFLVQVFIVFDKTSFLASVLTGVLTTLTNEERAQNDAAPLAKNDLLTRAAEMKANDMAASGYFAHTSPDGKTPWYWLNQVGYRYSIAGENLAVNFFESDDVAEAWMNSPTHRANIVKKNYTEVGIGVASGVYNGEKTVFVAQFFGTPIQTSPIISEVKETTTAPIKVEPKVTKPPTPKTTPTTTPKVSPPQTTPTNIAIAPTGVQVLGEETDTTATITDVTIASHIKSFIQKILASPREYVTYIFSIIILSIILVMLLVIFIKREFHHPPMLVRGAALVSVIIFLMFVNIKVLHLDTEVPTEGLSASVIAY